MIDTRSLIHALKEYHRSVQQHLGLVHDEFQRLNDRWKRLRQHFGGNSADEFEPHWHRTAQMFQHYDTAAKAIAAILARRIQDLEEVNRRSGLLG